MPPDVWNVPTTSAMNGIPDEKLGNVVIPTHILILAIRTLRWRVWWNQVIPLVPNLNLDL